MKVPTQSADAVDPQDALRAGKYADVCRHFEARAPTKPQDWLALGRARLALGEPTTAHDCFHKGLLAAPADLALQFYSASALARLGRWTEAEQALASCVSEPTWRERALATRAQLRVRAGLWADAEADYRDLEKLGRMKATDQLALSACLVSLSRWTEAEPLLDGLLTGSKPPELVWLLKGRCLEGQRHWAEAADLYRQGLILHPESQALAGRLLLTARRPAARRPDVLLLTLSSRKTLLADWSRRQSANPSDLKLAHRIALLASNGAQVLQRLRPGRARDWWRQALANWAMLSVDPLWQDAFLKERAGVHGQTPTDRDRSQFVEALNGHIDNLVELAQGERPPVGEPTLREEFLRELHAARACHQMLPGGIKLPAGGSFCGGPLLLVQHGLGGTLDKEWPRARRANPPEWLAWPDPEEWHSAKGQLQILYSSLGFAQARLEVGDPRGALDSLRWAICPACAASFRRSRPHEIPLCRADCPEFNSRNPGFASPGQGSGRLQAAAEWLRLQAHVAVVNLTLRVAEPNPADVVKHWTQAVELVGRGPRCDELLRFLVEQVLSRADELTRHNRSGAAVALLEATAGCHPNPAVFANVLAAARTSWGIDLANAGDPEAGAPQLRRALEANPLLTRARLNLVTVLGNLAHQAAQNKELERALGWLDEAETLCRCEGVLAAELAVLGDGVAVQRMDLLIALAAARYSGGGRADAIAALEQAEGLVGRKWADEEAHRQAQELASKVQEYLQAVRRSSG